MFAYGQSAANAIAVMSYLAANPARRARSGEIAEARGLSRALTAKILTQLASARFVDGKPGRGGGYTLARSPGDISLFDIVSLFEQTEPPTVCAFGRGWCGHGDPCPLHEANAELLALNRRFMEETRLSLFFPQTTPEYRATTRDADLPHSNNADPKHLCCIAPQVVSNV